MPELVRGFPRLPGYRPTRYPVACSPQAWSAGVAFQLLTAMLGLSASAEQNQLTLERLRLPGWLASAQLQNVRVGKSRLTLSADGGSGHRVPGLGGRCRAGRPPLTPPGKPRP